MEVAPKSALADVETSSESSSEPKTVSFHSVVGFRWTFARADLITEDLHYQTNDYHRFRQEEILRRFVVTSKRKEEEFSIIVDTSDELSVADIAGMEDAVGSSPKCAAHFEVMEKDFVAAPLLYCRRQQQEQEREREQHERAQSCAREHQELHGQLQLEMGPFCAMSAH